MNDKRRKRLKAIVEQLENLKNSTNSDSAEKLNSINYLLADIIEEEEEALSNMPENLQYSDKYEKAEDAVSNVEDAVYEIEEAIEYIEKGKYEVASAVITVAIEKIMEGAI